MPTIRDQPPPYVAARLAELRSHLDAEIPAKWLDHNLLIATWNIRAFGDLTEKWSAGKSDSPKRDLEALLLIAEIVSRFDVVAIQEVKGTIKALRHMLKALGPDWGLMLTDVTRGRPGNDERMAFVFDTRRVKPSGLAGELVVPEEWMRAENLSADALTKQFARTPFAVSFLAGEDTFILVTCHVLFGEGPADRTAELKGIARWLADWAEREESWGHNLIALGDFNIDRAADANYEAFTSTGLHPPAELSNVPRTIFGGGPDAFYDQIAWFAAGGGGPPVLSLDYSGRASYFDFVPLFPSSTTKVQLSWRMSDHYPLWVEFNAKRR